MGTHESFCVAPEEIKVLFGSDARLSHLREVVEMTTHLSDYVGLTHSEADMMQLVSWYHDVGYIVKGGWERMPR